MNTAVSLPDKNSDEDTRIAMGYRWYGFESYAEGGSLEAVLLTKEEFELVKKVFNTRETIYDEGYSGSVSLFGSEDGYESKLDLMRAYAKEASFLHTEDIIDKDMAAIIEKEKKEYPPELKTKTRETNTLEEMMKTYRDSITYRMMESIRKDCGEE